MPSNTASFGVSLRGTGKALGAMLEWRKQRSGMITSAIASAGAFFKSHPDVTVPDLQLVFVLAQVDDHARKQHLGHGISCHVDVLRPYSRGTVGLQSTDPRVAPVIDPRFLSDDRDVQLLLKGGRVQQRLIESSAFAPVRGKMMYPVHADDARAMEQDIRNRADTQYHPVGTCKMGPDSDPMAVVDAQLRVKGIARLRVADASIIPTVPVCALNATSMLIGHRAGRHDAFFERVASGVFWWSYRKLVQRELPPGGIDVFGCNAAFRTHLLRFSESHTSLVGQILWLGFRRVALPYVRQAREIGRSAWTFGRKLKYLSDSVFAFSDLPIRLFTLVGGLGVLLSITLGLFARWCWQHWAASTGRLAEQAAVHHLAAAGHNLAHVRGGLLEIAVEGREDDDRRVLVHRQDLCAGHHHIGHFQFTEAQQIGEHHPFLLRQGGFLALAFLDHFFQAFAHRRAGRSFAPQPLQQTPEQRPLAVGYIAHGVIS